MKFLTFRPDSQKANCATDFQKTTKYPNMQIHFVCMILVKNWPLAKLLVKISMFYPSHHKEFYVAQVTFEVIAVPYVLIRRSKQRRVFERLFCGEKDKNRKLQKNQNFLHVRPGLYLLFYRGLWKSKSIFGIFGLLTGISFFCRLKTCYSFSFFSKFQRLLCRKKLSFHAFSKVCCFYKF